MPDESSKPNKPLSEEYLQKHTVGGLRPLSGPILLVDSDSTWPRQYEEEAKRILTALGDRALRVEHVGSTSYWQSRSSTLPWLWRSQLTNRSMPQLWKRLVIVFTSANPAGMSIGCSKGETVA